jgi:hypothetical protein
MTVPSKETARAFLASLTLDSLGTAIRRRQLTTLAASYGPRFARQLARIIHEPSRQGFADPV